MPVLVAVMVVMSFLTIPTADGASTRPSRSSCRGMCAGEVEECISHGGRPRKCKRRIMHECRRRGLERCLTSSTMVTTTSTSTTSTVPLPAIDGHWLVTDQTCMRTCCIVGQCMPAESCSLGTQTLDIQQHGAELTGVGLGTLCKQPCYTLLGSIHDEGERVRFSIGFPLVYPGGPQLVGTVLDGGTITDAVVTTAITIAGYPSCTTTRMVEMTRPSATPGAATASTTIAAPP